ncbi:aldehyde dehydrogenase [Frankia sp. CNm7]|uniref:Aldehyde dehydrogenase n=1 Tax=Frankia nepalensis TaxID=1836974 RepID=A0A937R7A8_9ACTN|nr:aldehyde dehydrogenase [Frankia nepalensis]MBL7496809.1 aldehyde dehydrogenase [Frankia nepalensis]MBL7513936.1 aldehyde dehydrogenase [Frankia nepalensis]MBL7523714.1 aldehyde dehydrogenase [Frankia nepalensis]MBL7626631.1 aldehyde dehydrogenase [Frankia nepalensis]
MSESQLYRRTFYIDGAWAEPAGTETLDVISPSTEAPVGGVPAATTADIDRAVAAARAAFDDGPWPRTSPAERAEVLTRAAAELRKREDEIARVTTDEMGCAASQSKAAQTGLVAVVFDYYAELIRSYEFERLVTAGPRAGIVTSEPVGVVGAIVPWNAPITLAAWKTAPALAAGCPVVLKPAPESPLSAYVFAEAMEAAGVPAGLVNVVPGGREVGEHLVTHPGVDKIAFTGSTAAGKRIMSLCGEQVKRVSLELGGKSASILLDDADLATVVPTVVHGGMHLSGQVCGAHTRVLVPRSRYEEALAIAGAAADAEPVGDPHDPAVIVGPLVAERQRARVEGLIAGAVADGVRVVAGGKRPAHLPKGWYVAPTILGDVHNGLRIAREEIFGPVLSFIPYEDSDDAADAVRIANDSDYGLSGGVWSGDPARALAVARRLRTGSVAVNGSYPPFPLVPFGGFKQSGLGRELGPEGLEGFLEKRSIGLPPALVPGA